MTRKDCEQQGLQYYDVWPKKGGKDEGAKRISVQPVLKKGNSKSESVGSGSDSSVDIEFFGPIWDNIDSKDGVVERSDERACEPDIENFTSESE